jgi:hypothetical protein
VKNIDGLEREKQEKEGENQRIERRKIKNATTQ